MSDILSEACSLTGWVSTATNTETSCHVLRRCHAGAEGGCTRRYTALSLLCHSRGREESSDPASPASSQATAYSCRRATTGEIRAARRAGRWLARRPTRSSTSDAVANDHTSVAPTP